MQTLQCGIMGWREKVVERVKTRKLNEENKCVDDARWGKGKQLQWDIASRREVFLGEKLPGKRGK